MVFWQPIIPAWRECHSWPQAVIPGIIGTCRCPRCTLWDLRTRPRCSALMLRTPRFTKSRTRSPIWTQISKRVICQFTSLRALLSFQPPNACCFKHLSNGIRLQLGTERSPTLSCLTLKVCKTVQRQKGQLGQVLPSWSLIFVAPHVLLGLAFLRLPLEFVGGSLRGRHL